MLAGLADAIQELLKRSPFGLDGLVTHSQLVYGVAASTLAYMVGNFIIYRLYFHPLARIPGPSVSWIPFTGNLRELLFEESCEPDKKWAKKYGGILVYHTAWNAPVVSVTDPALLKEIFTLHAYDYSKTKDGAAIMERIFGKGLLVTEGDVHRTQRRILNQAFTIQAVRTLTPYLYIPPVQLIAKWRSLFDAKPDNEDYLTLDISHALTMASLDEIGIGAFGVDFQAIKYDGSEKENKMAWAYMVMMDPNGSLFHFLSLFLPILLIFPSKRNRTVNDAMRVLREEGQELVKRALEYQDDEKASTNLLALIIRLLDNKNGVMDPEELRNHCMTFLAAGHETTSTTLSWCLWKLAQNQDLQKTLRAEVAPIVEKINAAHAMFHSDTLIDPDSTLPSLDEINSLPFLNNVCKEILRLTPPVPVTQRMTVKDVSLGGYFIPKGSTVNLPIMTNYHDPTIWGDDAEEFRPSRWDEELASNVSPYEYMPFLAGPRQCIGYRFALAELKIMLAILIANFEFFDVPGQTFSMKQFITLRPDPNMMLRVKPVQK